MTTIGRLEEIMAEERPRLAPPVARERTPEWRAALAWIARSWVRPADAEVGWEQHAGRGGVLPSRTRVEA